MIIVHSRKRQSKPTEVGNQSLKIRIVILVNTKLMPKIKPKCSEVRKGNETMPVFLSCSQWLISGKTSCCSCVDDMKYGCCWFAVLKSQTPLLSSSMATLSTGTSDPRIFRVLTLRCTRKFLPPPRYKGGGGVDRLPQSFWYVIVFQNNFAFSEKPLIFSTRWGINYFMGGGAAGGLWHYQQWSPFWLPSWILPRIRNQVKTVINGNFLCWTLKITHK